ncbi:MAG: CPBP family intramembrane metalloprotease [Bacillaceae bacterium]|nr:CPBP family intramembrane metalloprotease [Bacillaceae bacterium]
MPKRYWYVILTYIIVQFSSIIGIPLLMLFQVPEEHLVSTWVIISFTIGVLVTLYLLKPDMVRYERTSSHAKTIILWSVLGIFMALFAQAIAANIEWFLFDIKPGSENTQNLMNIARQSPAFLIVPILYAPILEEIIFRKIIFGTFYKRMNFFLAALLSAVIFGLIHLDPEHLLIYSSMGLVFAYLYVKTKQIIVPIMAHLGMNTMAVLAQYSLTPEDIERMQKELEQLQTILIGG